MAYTSKAALLAGIIDYAGTFPPAALSLDDVLRTAASFRKRARHPWLVGKLAVGLADIKTIDARRLYGLGADGDPWLFTALGAPPKEKGPAGLAGAVEWDLREINRYNDRHFDGPLRLWICGYETRIPADALASGTQGAVYDCVAPALDRFLGTTRCHVDPFLEVGLEGNWRASLDAAVGAISGWLERTDESGLCVGVKVRAGGALVPTSEQLAAVVGACAAHGLRFKATQGLHHALRRPGEHGFVNLFATLALTYALGIDAFPAAEAEKCLEDGDPKSFRFAPDHFAWRDRKLTLEQIESARRRHAATFGSCSADEPDEALAQELKD